MKTIYLVLGIVIILAAALGIFFLSGGNMQTFSNLISGHKLSAIRSNQESQSLDFTTNNIINLSASDNGDGSILISASDGRSCNIYLGSNIDGIDYTCADLGCNIAISNDADNIIRYGFSYAKQSTNDAPYIDVSSCSDFISDFSDTQQVLSSDTISTDLMQYTGGSARCLPDQICPSPVSLNVPPQSYNYIDNGNGRINFVLGIDSATNESYVTNAGDLIAIDPTITINDVSVLGNYINTKPENNFTHLSVSNPNITLYMPFDVNTSGVTYDYSNNNISATFGNEVNWFSNGPYGSSYYSFRNSSAMITIPSTFDILQEDKPITIIVLVNPAGLLANNRIIDRRTHISATAGMYFGVTSDGTADFEVSGGTAVVRKTNSADVAQNTWQMLAVSWNGTTNASQVHIYKNGVELTYSLTTNGINLNDTSGFPTIIGNRNDGIRGWNGQIDNLIIYNYALNSSDILKIFQNTSSIFYPSGTASYNFSKNTGDDAVNVTLSFQSLLTTNITARTECNGVNSAWTTGINLKNITLTAGSGTMCNLTLNLTSDANSFYTPNLLSPIIIDTYPGAPTPSQISLTLLTPPNLNNINVTQGLFFNVAVNVSCLNADCGDINVSLDPTTTTQLGSSYIRESGFFDDNSGSETYAPMIKFDISSISASSINDATFCYYINDIQGSSTGSIDAEYTLNQSWTINTDAGIMAGYTYSNLTTYSVSTTIGTWVCINITNQAKQSFANSDKNFTLRIKPQGTTISPLGPISFPLEPSQYGVDGQTQFNTTTGPNLPYLNITYIAGGGSSGKGLISTTIGATPFYTNQSNPRNISLSQGQSQVVTFYVNATGTVGNSYIFYAFANQTSNMTISNSTGSWNVTIQAPQAPDTTPPYFITIPAGQSVIFGNGLNVQFVGNDTTAFGTYYLGNWTSLFNIDSSGFLRNSSANPAIGNYIINVTINDTSGNTNFTLYNFNVTAIPSDAIYPQFSNFQISLINNSAYNFNTNYQFNTTIVNTNGTAGIGFNGVNYSLSNLSSSFYKLFPSLAAGVYPYYFWAYGNGSSHNYNTTSIFSYTVAKANLTGRIDGTEIYQYSTQTTVTGSETNLGDADVVYNLYRNNILVSNPDVQILGVGSYIYIYNSTGGQNYSSSSNIMNNVAKIFSNAPTYMTIPTYDGTNESVHPSVLYFPNTWNGYYYWLCDTPYHNQDENLENPSIFATNGTNGVLNYTTIWSVPAGLTNPITPAHADPNNHYNSDCDIVYNNDTNQLYAFYRYQELPSNFVMIVSKNSSDGIHWSAEQNYTSLMWTGYPYPIAPEVLYINGQWQMFVSNKLDAVPNLKQAYTFSSDGLNWANLTNTTLTAIWHGDTIYNPAAKEYITIYVPTSTSPDIYMARSTDKINWQKLGGSILHKSASGWDGDYFYRPTFLYNTTGNDEINLIYPAYPFGGALTPHVGFTNESYMSMLSYASSENMNLTIIKNYSFALGLSASTPITYGQATDFTGSGCPSQLTCSLNISNAVYAAGIINANYSTIGNANYTGNSAVFGVTINKAQSRVDLYLNGVESSEQVDIHVNVNITANLITGQFGSFNLTIDGGQVNYSTSQNLTYVYFTPTPQATHWVNATYSGNTNFTSNFSSWYIQVKHNGIPVVSIDYPVNMATYNISTLGLNYSVVSPIPDSCWYSKNMGVLNSSKVIAGVNFTNVLGVEGEQTWTVYCNDSNNVEGFHSHTFNIDTLPPSVTNLAVSPANNSVYSLTQLYQFNATITHSIQGIYAWLQVNGINYTASNSSSVYNVTFKGLAAGVYSYRWFANDSLGQLNNSEAGSYTIAQASPTLNYLLNSQNANNITVTPPYFLNASASVNFGTIKIDVNGTDITSSNGLNVSYSIGYYKFTYNSTGNQNYTDSANYYLFANISSVVDTTPPYFTTIPANVTINYTQGFAVTFAGADVSSPPAIFSLGNFNNLFIINSSGYLQNITGNIGVGSFIVNVTITDGVGNTNFTLYNVTVNKAITSLGLSASTPITYGQATNFTGSGCNSQISCSLNISNAVYQAGIINANYSTIGNTNYTASSAIFGVTINQATPSLTYLLNGAIQNITAPTPYDLNASASTTAGDLKIYVNGTDITSSNGLNITYTIGYYIFDYNVTGNQNYTDVADKFLFANITAGACVPNLQNTSKSSYINIGCIDSTGYQNQSRNWTQYDANNCGYVNQTFFEYQSVPDASCSGNPSFTNCRNLAGFSNQSFAQSITATDASGISSYWLNDTSLFNVNSAGLIRNDTATNYAKLINLIISVNNSFNHISNCSFSVNIISAGGSQCGNVFTLLKSSLSGGRPYGRLCYWLAFN